MSKKPRSGTGIREFLEYYLLVMLNENSMDKEKIIETIKQRSSDNQNYRPGSALCIAEDDLEQVLQALMESNFVKSDEKGKNFTLTDEGREALQEMNKTKEQVKSSKEDATDKLISILVSDAGEKANEKYVLDVGTGSGYLAFKLSDAGFNVLGIDSSDFDYSKDSIKNATEKAQGKPNLRFQVADVKEMEMEEKFDYIVSSQAVHCMRDQKGCISSTYSLLKRGGMLVVSDFLIGLKGFFVHGVHSFLALSKEEWKEILYECGYDNIKIHEINDFCIVEARKLA